MKRSSIFPFLFLLLLLAFSCATGQDVTGPAYTLTGETRYLGEKLTAGEVVLSGVGPGGAVHRTMVGKDGSFAVVLPPGPYLLTGWGTDPATGKRLFAYWNNNPVRLHQDGKEPVILPFVESTGPPTAVNGEGITGRVLNAGSPVPGAVVGAFLDSGEGFHGLPYAESRPAGADGGFHLSVEPGRYYLLARVRSGGGAYQGPLLKGDLAGYYPHNPVILRTGEAFVLDIPVMRINRPRGAGSLAHGEAIIVAGTVKDVAGEPVPGVRVVIYASSEMLGRPDFISSPTDGKGGYRLEVPRGGTFYAAARSVIGRPPETGELMGFYDGTEDHSLTLEVGDRLEGVDIVVREVW